MSENKNKKVVLFYKNPLAFGDKYTDNYSESIEYDDIVDTSHFKPSSETIRDKIASGNIGSGDKGLYDFEKGVKVTKENDISDVELALRSGKLDKADVQKLSEIYNDKAQKDVKDKKDSDLLAKERQAQVNRTKALDKKLNVNQDSSDVM